MTNLFGKKMRRKFFLFVFFFNFALIKYVHTTIFHSQTMKHIILTLAAFTAALSLSAQVNADPLPATSPAAQPVAAPAQTRQPVHEAVRFGYLSYKDALHNMPGYAAALRQVEALRKAYEQEVARNKDEFSKQFSEFIVGQQSFPENILLKRQKELEQLMEGSLRFKAEAKQLLDQKEKDTMQPLRERLAAAIRQIGMERGYAFVVNTDGDTYPFVNGTTGDDITADVLKLLK